ncbi:hypothetical protein NA63_1814 [Flavobacteriaceae bacterium MAR_2010_105]|nr:hypothetical protein NA63_1814 [Flavobacteriaceae bacterium MAR_2010_105]
MKNYILFFFVIFVFQLSSAQNTFKADDLNGQWISTKPGAELVLAILQSQATIVSLGKSSLTKSLIGGNMYDGITYEGDGNWKAQRNSWIYNGMGGNNSDSGRWEKGPKLTLKLSSDKNTLSASGHWSYKRVVKVIEDSTLEKNSRSVLIEDFGGLNGKFTSGNTSTKSIIVTQLTNKTKDKTAYVSLKTDNGTETLEYINPGGTLTKKYDTKNLDIKVIYFDSQKPTPSLDIIQSTKEYVREKVTNENGVIKIEKMSESGVRG